MSYPQQSHYPAANTPNLLSEGNLHWLAWGLIGLALILFFAWRTGWIGATAPTSIANPNEWE